MKKRKVHAEYSTYTPESPEDAANWYHSQKEKKRVVYWDRARNRLISSDDSDLRNLPVEDRSKLARIFSEANIIDFLTSHWESTPIADGGVEAVPNSDGRIVLYKGRRYILKEVTRVKK